MVIVIIIVIIMIATVTSEIKSLRSRIRNTIFKNFFFKKNWQFFLGWRHLRGLKTIQSWKDLRIFFLFFLSWCSPLWSFLLPASTKSSEKSERKKTSFQKPSTRHQLRVNRLHFKVEGKSCPSKISIRREMGGIAQR